MQGGTERYHSEINAERPRGPIANMPREVDRVAWSFGVNEALTTRQAAVDASARG